MSKPKGAAKAAPAKKAASDVVEVAPKEWPDLLPEEKAIALCALVIDGETVRGAAKQLGFTPGQVYQWKHRFAKFGALVDEALAIGYDVILDEFPAIADAAFDKNSAAAAAIKIAAREKYLQGKHPARFKTSPFKAMEAGGEGQALLGVVLVPMKVTQQDERPIIEGSAVRVPMKALTP